MKRPRFLVAVAEEPTELAAIEARLKGRRDAGPKGLMVVLRAESALVFAEPGESRRWGKHAVLIGSIFSRDGRGPLRPSDDDADAGILVERGWGGYIFVSVRGTGSGVQLFRAPLGDLPCYHSSVGRGLLFGSDLSLLCAAGLPRPKVNAPELARHLAADDLRTAATCLEGVSEIQGGECLTIRHGWTTRDVLWSPWNLGADIAISGDPAARIREAITNCVCTLANQSTGVVLKLSGGLDSSIVAACLRHSDRPFLLVNLATHDPASDEREYARIVARAIGGALHEHFREPSGVVVEHSAAARLPRPTARSFAQETARIVGEAAAGSRSDVVMDGGGGDNIFCSLQSARPAADCLLMHAGARTFSRTVQSIAELAQASVWAVARRALAIRNRRLPDYPWDIDLSFLSSDAQAEGSRATHPWLHAPAGALPGRAGHIALVAAAQSVVEGFDVEEALPTYSPLMSQPVVEECLRVPTWLWFENGHNRALARRAFSSELPQSIVSRRSKGAPDGFLAELFESNQAKIRSMLLDGALMRLGLLDADLLEAALADTGPVRGHDFLRLMRLTDVEAWARCWTG